MVNKDFQKYLTGNHDVPEEGGEYIEYTEVMDVLGGDLAEIKKFLIKSASHAVCQEYPLAEVVNKGGSNLSDPIVLSISLRKTVDVTRVKRFEVKHKEGP